MKIIKIISANKKNKHSTCNGKIIDKQYKSKIGHAMCIVEENGEIKTRHMVAIE